MRTGSCAQGGLKEEEGLKEGKAVGRTWLLYFKSDWRLVRLGAAQDHSVLTPTAEFGGGVSKTTFRFKNSLEELRTHQELLHSQLQFITVKGYTFNYL